MSQRDKQGDAFNSAADENRLHNSRQDIETSKAKDPHNDKSTSGVDSLHHARAQQGEAYQSSVGNDSSQNRGDVAQVQHAARTNTISYSTGEDSGDEIGGATGLNKSGAFDRVSEDIFNKDSQSNMGQSSYDRQANRGTGSPDFTKAKQK